MGNIMVGSAPDSWGVWFPDDPQQTPYTRFLDEVAASGYEWIEPVDLAANAASLGADVIRVVTAAEFGDAVKVAKASDRTTVIHVETDPLIAAPDSESWWDVPVSEVSTLESTQTAYQRYADWKKVQRPLINPSDR